MSRAYPRIVLGVLGIAVLVVVATGQYTSYVRAGTWPALVITGLTLVVLAGHGALREWQHHDAVRRTRTFGVPAESGHSGHGHTGPAHTGHAHTGSTWVLLLAPVACLALLAPPSLGSYSAARAPDAVLAAPDTTDIGFEDLWEPLPAGGVVPLPLSEFITRARWDDSKELERRTVRLTGFVLPRPVGRAGDEPWQLARMGINCCAADATVYRVRMADPGGLTVTDPAADSWVEVEGRWVSEPAAATDPVAVAEPPLLRIERVRSVPVPEQPYD